MTRVAPPQQPVAGARRSEMRVQGGAAGREVQPAAGPFERAEDLVRAVARMVVIGLAQHAAYLAHEGGGPHVVPGDVADRQCQPARRVRTRCHRQGIGVVPVTPHHVVLPGRPVQGRQFQAGYVGEFGEHGPLQLPGDGHPFVEVQGTLDGLGRVAGERGQDRPLVHADPVRGVPAQDQRPEGVVRAAQGQADGRAVVQGVERRGGRWAAGSGVGPAALRRRMDHDHPVLAHRPCDRPVRTEGEGLGAGHARRAGHARPAGRGETAVDGTRDVVEHPLPHQDQVDAGRPQVPADQVPDLAPHVLQTAGAGEVLRRPQEQLGPVEEFVHTGRLPRRRVRRVLRRLAGLTDRLGARPHPHLRAARRGEVRQVPYVVLAPRPEVAVRDREDAQELPRTPDEGHPAEREGRAVAATGMRQEAGPPVLGDPPAARQYGRVGCRPGRPAFGDRARGFCCRLQPDEPQRYRQEPRGEPGEPIQPVSSPTGLHPHPRCLPS